MMWEKISHQSKYHGVFGVLFFSANVGRSIFMGFLWGHTDPTYRELEISPDFSIHHLGSLENNQLSNKKMFLGAQNQPMVKFL